MAVSLANYGESVEFITRLPNNELGDACLAELRSHGLETGHILRGGERLGIYFLESGAAQRASKVIYDRAGSGFCHHPTRYARLEGHLCRGRLVPLDRYYSGCLAGRCRGVSGEAIVAAREMGVTVSCDLNYRAKLWKWGKAAGEVMGELVGLCDLAIGNEEDAEKVFGMRAPTRRNHCRQGRSSFLPFCLRSSGGAFPIAQNRLHHSAGFALGQPQHLVRHSLVERRVLYRSHTTISCPSLTALAAATRSWAVSFTLCANSTTRKRRSILLPPPPALNATIPGDFNSVSVAEVETLMAGDASGAGCPANN